MFYFRAGVRVLLLETRARMTRSRRVILVLVTIAGGILGGVLGALTLTIEDVARSALLVLAVSIVLAVAVMAALICLTVFSWRPSPGWGPRGMMTPETAREVATATKERRRPTVTGDQETFLVEQARVARSGLPRFVFLQAVGAPGILVIVVAAVVLAPTITTWTTLFVMLLSVGQTTSYLHMLGRTTLLIPDVEAGYS